MTRTIKYPDGLRYWRDPETENVYFPTSDPDIYQMMTSAEIAEKWGEQDIQEGWELWKRKYQESKSQPNRQGVLSILRGLGEITNLLELGCHLGPMLELIHDEWPAMKLMGIEANTLAAQECADHLPVNVFAGDMLEWLTRFPDRSVDIILSYYALAYVPPCSLPDTLKECRRVARRALVFCEPMATDELPPKMIHNWPEWRHDYLAPLKSMRRVTVFGLSYSQNALNRILLAEV